MDYIIEDFMNAKWRVRQMIDLNNRVVSVVEKWVYTAFGSWVPAEVKVARQFAVSAFEHGFGKISYSMQHKLRAEYEYECRVSRHTALINDVITQYDIDY